MLIKSIFISTYLTLLHTIVGYTIYQLSINGFQWAWVGVLFAALPGTIFFDVLLILRPFARTSAHLKWITAATLAGVLTTVLSSLLLSEFNAITNLLALLSILGWLAYDYWYSHFNERSNPILQPGQTLPTLNFQLADKTAFSTKQLDGSLTLYIFYRGNWCPLCMAQIQEVASQYQALADRGVKIALISPQSHQSTMSLAKRFRVPFLFLVDPDNKVARQLGIIAENGLPMGMQVLGYDSDTVMPTVLMTDQHHKIIFADLTDNYRVRPEPETFLRILDEYTK